MNFRCQFYVCVIVLYHRVSCYRSGHTYESPAPDRVDQTRDLQGDNYFKISNFYSTLPKQGSYGDRMRDKDPPLLLPIYHWKVFKSGVLQHKRTVGTEFLGKRSEFVEDIDFDDSLQKPCKQHDCVDK